jgi:hypothetical protein
MVDISVIVRDGNFICVTIQPSETDSKLVIDANAVLPFSIAFKRFESITGWNAQIFNVDRSIQRFQFATSSLFDIHEFAYPLAVKQGFRVFVCKSPDHGLDRISINEKQQACSGLSIQPQKKPAIGGFLLTATES